MFKLTLKIGEREHWVEIDQEVWTRRDLRAFEAVSLGDDDDLRAWYVAHVRAMHLTNEDGQVATDPAQLTDEFFESCDAALMGFLRNLGFRAYTTRSTLGEVSGGRS